MEIAFAFIFLLLFFLAFVDLMAEPLAELIAWLVVFLFKCIAAAIAFIAIVSFRLVVWLLIRLWRGLVLAAEFLIIFADELIHRDDVHDEGEPGADRHDDDHHDGRPDNYAQALGVIGMGPGFTREELRQRYRQRMKRAHPDTPGGSHEAARALNEAYDVVRRKHGWA